MIRTVIKVVNRPVNKLMLFAAVLFISFSIVVSTTWSWIEGTAQNNISFINSNLNIELADTLSSVTTINAGAAYSQTAAVRNNGDQNQFVRVMLLPVITSSLNTILTNSLNTLPSGQTVTFGINTTDWADGGDGYYYYKHVLEPGQTTPAIFTSITIGSTLDSYLYDGASMKIDVKCEACGIVPSTYYRTCWWGESTPSSAPLSTIDSILLAASIA